MNKKVLVVAAHPDDEILGCGATMAKHVQSGDSVHVAILAEGITSRDNIRKRDDHKNELSELGRVAHVANQTVGANSLDMYEFPDNRMDSVELLDVVKRVEQLIEKYQPEIVYTHHGGDVNIDHQLIHKAVVTACRPIPHHSVKTLLFFEVPSSTEWQVCSSVAYFTPNWFVDVSDTFEIKLQALQAYEMEMRSWPHSRSIEAITHLLSWRGASVGVQAAEAFVLGRNIV